MHDCDFTIHKFRRLCEAIAGTYSTVTMTEYMDNQHPDRFALMRHDVDRMSGHALETARIEHELGIRATYYFRSTRSVFRPDIMRQISGMGHEIGYHYETLSEANGDPDKAIELFRSHLDKFRTVCDVRTICMHGRPLSKYDNRDLWNINDFRDFGITGEAYLSVGDELNYFSDTGRGWSNRNSLRDFIAGKTQKFTIDTTDDLIGLIESKEADNFYVLTHPERWSLSAVEWMLYFGVDMAINIGKKVIATVRT